MKGEFEKRMDRNCFFTHTAWLSESRVSNDSDRGNLQLPVILWGDFVKMVDEARKEFPAGAPIVPMKEYVRWFQKWFGDENK